MKYIENHPEKYWNWYAISCNPNITMEYIDAHANDPKKPWIWDAISRNPNLTTEYIDAHP